MRIAAHSRRSRDHRGRDRRAACRRRRLAADRLVFNHQLAVNRLVTRRRPTNRRSCNRRGRRAAGHGGRGVEAAVEGRQPELAAGLRNGQQLALAAILLGENLWWFVSARGGRQLVS